MQRQRWMLVFCRLKWLPMYQLWCIFFCYLLWCCGSIYLIALHPSPGWGNYSKSSAECLELEAAIMYTGDVSLSSLKLDMRVLVLEPVVTAPALTAMFATFSAAQSFSCCSSVIKPAGAEQHEQVRSLAFGLESYTARTRNAHRKPNQKHTNWGFLKQMLCIVCVPVMKFPIVVIWALIVLVV